MEEQEKSLAAKDLEKIGRSVLSNLKFYPSTWPAKDLAKSKIF